MQETRKPFTNNIESAVKEIVYFILNKDMTSQLSDAFDQTNTEYVVPTQGYSLYAFIKWLWRDRVETFTTAQDTFQKTFDPILALESIKKLFLEEAGGWDTTSVNTVLLKGLLRHTTYELEGVLGTNDIKSLRGEISRYPIVAIKEAENPPSIQYEKPPARVVGKLTMTSEEYAAVTALFKRQKDFEKPAPKKVSTLPDKKERPPRRKLDMSQLGSLEGKLNAFYGSLIPKPPVIRKAGIRRLSLFGKCTTEQESIPRKLSKVLEKLNPDALATSESRFRK